MDTLLYVAARAGVALVQALPLRIVARLGRAAGALAFWLARRTRRVAIRNLTLCFGAEKSPVEIQALAKENYRRLGENLVGAIKTAAMTPDQLRPHLEWRGAEKILPRQLTPGPQSRVVALGHFGNFELYARFGQFVPGFQCATTYRALHPASLNRILQSLRARSGCRFFERRTEAAALRAAMADTGLLLGLLADQRAIRGGTRLPFFGQDCSTSLAPAVLALRYRCPLYTAICYRTGLARWRVEVGNAIPLVQDGRVRSAIEITGDINRAFELAIRRDPANWFWVHDRWKQPKSEAQQPKPEAKSSAADKSSELAEAGKGG